MESLYCRIYGRVQRVMFRDFATRKARKCRIKGYVRNMVDGSVEAYGEGEGESLERWLAYLHHGPILARVDHVNAKWGSLPPEDIRLQPFDSFDIVF